MDNLKAVENFIKEKSPFQLDTWFGRPKKGGSISGGTSATGSSSVGDDGVSQGSGDGSFGPEREEGTAVERIDYKELLKNLDDRQLDEKFNEMLSDMNLSEEKKTPLKACPRAQKEKMLLAYKGVTQEGKSKFEKPSDYITYLSQSEISVGKLHSCLENLRISLTNNPLKWIEEFGQRGIGVILSTLSECYRNDGRYDRPQYECIRCLSAIMNNTVGIRAVFEKHEALIVLARSLDPAKPLCMIEAAKVLAATCLIPEGHEKVLEAVTINGENRNRERFQPIIKGLKSDSEPLKVSCMQLLNAIITEPDELDFRMHLRNEVMRAGFYDVIEKLRQNAGRSLEIQMTVFDHHAEEDHDEFIGRFDSVRLEFEDVNDCFELVKNLTLDTAAEPYLLSILQHLLFIRDDHAIRPAYYKLIEECVTQIVLHRNGYDPDFRATAKFNIDVKPLIDGLVEKSRAEDERRFEELNEKLEQALASRQEAEAKVAHLETKLQQIGQANPGALTGNTIGAIAKSIQSPQGGPPPPPPIPGSVGPPPPPMPGMGGGGPPPPPMPGMGGQMPPPPPPFPGGGGGPPPPPPPPGMGPPPPAFGMGMPPPPMMPIPDVLPHGMKPKKKYEVDGPLKRANWKSIIPQRMSEKSFWVGIKEDRLASPDILGGLAQKFSSRPQAKKSEDAPDRVTTMKKVKDLKVLDPKAAQNISILLGGALKHMSYSAVRKCLMKCDTEVLTSNILDLLIQYLPPPEQLKKLSELKDSYKDLTEAEQFAVTVADVKRLLPRLKSLSFKQHYKELVTEIKPDIVSGTAACEEVKASGKFAKILELVLLLGNYMNTGSKNAGAFGFEISFLTKLTSTKDLENKHTLLHYLVDTIENKFPEVLTFNEEISHVDKASRVSMDNLQKALKKMEADIKNLETDLANSKVPQDADDKFYTIMAPFAEESRAQCNVLHSMLKKMEELYVDLAEFFAFDQAKYTLEDFFGDIKIFKDSFATAHHDNVTIRETEERARRAREARGAAEREREERVKRHKQFVNMDATQEGVMDSLMEAMSSGLAFSRERQRKKGPRVAGAERRAQLSRSRSRSGLTGGMSTRELSNELLSSA